LIQTREGDDVREYRYDGRGNLTEIIENGRPAARYVFDATNMMTEAFVSGKGRAQYVYDGLRNRVKKIETPQGADEQVQETRYVLDMTRPYDNLLMSLGAQNQSFVWGNELISASGDENYYYLQDHLGSPIRLLGDDGADTPLAYDEFGVPLAGAAQGGRGLHDPFGFTGYRTDDIAGLYCAQARYYMPDAGRFLSEDIIKGHIAAPKSLNAYAYCLNNPLVFADASGLKPYSVKALGGDQGKYTLFVAPQWLDAGQSAVGMIPLVGAPSSAAHSIFLWGFGYREIGYDLTDGVTDALGAGTGVGDWLEKGPAKSVLAKAGWGLKALEAASYPVDWLATKKYQTEEAVSNSFDYDIWVSSKRETVDKKFEYVMNEMNARMSSGRIVVRKAVDVFGESAFLDFGGRLGMGTYKFDPLRGEMRIYGMDEYYFFKTDSSGGCDISEIEDTVTKPKKRQP
jgi:RHS repeat-associated protein